MTPHTDRSALSLAKTGIEEHLNRYGTLLFTNQGSSMRPLIRQGKDAFVIQKKGAGRCKKYDAVLYKCGGKYILHRILQVREQDYVICGDNCFRREYGITDRNILGVMTEVIRGGKTVKVTHPGYLLYVHLWCDFFPVRAALLRLRGALGRLVRRLK